MGEPQPWRGEGVQDGFRGRETGDFHLRLGLPLGKAAGEAPLNTALAGSSPPFGCCQVPGNRGCIVTVARPELGSVDVSASGEASVRREGRNQGGESRRGKRVRYTLKTLRQYMRAGVRGGASRGASGSPGLCFWSPQVGLHPALCGVTGSCAQESWAW